MARMIDSLPTVQRARRARRIVNCAGKPIRVLKRMTHRARRRSLRLKAKAIVADPDLFDRETFNARSLSSTDID